MTATAALLCLATAIYHEARGEPAAGQLAVAQVVVNRARQSSQDACQVIREAGQFTWSRQAPKPTGKAWRAAQRLARRVLRGQVKDPTHGATHFHHHAVKPSWRKAIKRTVTIGQHQFYRLAANP